MNGTSGWGTGKNEPGFFPFNNPLDSSNASKLNYGFGSKIEIQFKLTADGKVKNIKEYRNFDSQNDYILKAYEYDVFDRVISMRYVDSINLNKVMESYSYAYDKNDNTSGRQLYVPRGFAHGFLTLTDDVEFRYKVDNLYSKEHDRGIRYDDPTINVDWGNLLNGIEPILSEKDTTGPLLDDSDCNFVYEGEI